MSGSITMRVGDTRPILVITLVDAQGVPVQGLTGSTVEVVVRDATTGVEVWRNVAGIDDDQAANPGVVRYDWREQDTAAPGEYLLDFAVTYSDGGVQTYPTDEGIPFVLRAGLPVQPDMPLVVDPDRLARMLRISGPIPDDVRDSLVENIYGAQDEVEGYLHRAIIPRQSTESLNPYVTPGSYSGSLLTAGPFTDQMWPVSNDPVVSIDSVVDDPNNPGWSLVTYTHGYDARTDVRFAAIRRYVTYAAVESFRRDNPQYARVRSMSVEGQSLTLDVPYGAAVRWEQGNAGDLPTLKSLSRWKKRSLFSRSRQAAGSEYPFGDYYGSGIGGIGGMAGVAVVAGPDGYSMVDTTGAP